jgi:hypothetical protein
MRIPTGGIGGLGAVIEGLAGRCSAAQQTQSVGVGTSQMRTELQRWIFSFLFLFSLRSIPDEDQLLHHRRWSHPQCASNKILIEFLDLYACSCLDAYFDKL